MISVLARGRFARTNAFLEHILGGDIYRDLQNYGERGVQALASATPMDSGLTANSWTYEITSNGKETTITWYNTNRNGRANVAILLQYGHGTGTGGYVQGRDYINPAIQPVMDQIAAEVWRRFQS